MTLQETPTDPRTQRTLALLEEAMTSLLYMQSVGEINVSELCRVAGIHRTTFYKHFSSVAEFAATLFAVRIDELAAVSGDTLPEAADEVPQSYRRALVGMLDHIAADRSLYRRLFAADSDQFFQHVVIDLMTARAAEAHRALAERGREVRMDQATAARMVGGACVAALSVWAEQDATDSDLRAREIMAALPWWWHWETRDVAAADQPSRTAG